MTQSYFVKKEKENNIHLPFNRTEVKVVWGREVGGGGGVLYATVGITADWQV